MGSDAQLERKMKPHSVLPDEDSALRPSQETDSADWLYLPTSYLAPSVRETIERRAWKLGRATARPRLGGYGVPGLDGRRESSEKETEERSEREGGTDERERGSV